MNILILGVNGFIGNSLVKRILKTTDWNIFGMDVSFEKLEHSVNNPRFHFIEGDISINREWVEYHIKKCDVVIPLVAVATPKIYIERPLYVFQLDFEENLRIVRQCVKYKKRVVFPSSSEVYGMCNDEEFQEDSSCLVMGPINKHRWIYACSKQLLDRVIWSYGHEENLQFTLFRPFNWIGPKLDDINTAKEGSSRVVTQFIIDLSFGKQIKLVDSGNQKRCYTYIDDGIDCLMKIIENKNGVCNAQIFNIGNPKNECSVKDLAYRLRTLFEHHEKRPKGVKLSEIIEVTNEDFYGKGYQDVSYRRPAIEKSKNLLGWEPKVSLDEALKLTLDFFLGPEN